MASTLILQESSRNLQLTTMRHHILLTCGGLYVGIIAGFVGIMFKLIFGIVHRVFVRFAKRPVGRAIIGGVVIGLIGSFIPLTLYSGQDQLLKLSITQPPLA